MPIITYSSKLKFASKKDEKRIFNMLEAQCEAYNAASSIHFGAENNSIVDLHAKFYRKFRDEHPEIPSQIVISAEQECLVHYRSIKTSKYKIKKAPQKKNLCMRLDARSFSYKRGMLSIISLEKRVKCNFQKYPRLSEVLEKYPFRDPLIFIRNGEIWINLPIEIQTLVVKENSVCGIDLGKRMAAVTSEGKFYQDKKFNREMRKLRHTKDSLKSKGTKSAKRHLRMLRRKEANKNKNQSHILSKVILIDSVAEVIALEDLRGVKNKKHKYQNKNSISQVPFAQLRRNLTYKAPFYGKTVIEVNPSYTSQIDHRTGKKDGKRQGRRYYGADGIVLDSDHNASINIALRSKHPASYPLILDGQAVVTRPIVCKSSQGV